MSQNLSRTAATAAPPTVPRRLHHLDALRGGALLLGVLLHALMPYAPGQYWLVNDEHESWVAIGAVSVIHLFRMALFMWLAGYFGRMVLHRRGAGSYVRDRLLRIGLPLLVFWPGVAVAVIGAMTLHALRLGIDLAPPSAGEGAGTGAGFLSLPTMHLWFLLLLLEIALVVVAVRAVLLRVLGESRASRASRGLAAALSSPFALLLVATPYAVGLIVQEGQPTSVTEPYTLMPVAGASIAYAGAFLAGWFLQAQPEALARVERRWIPHLVIAVVLSPVSLLAQTALPAPLLSIVAALAGWAWVYGLLGLMGRLVTREIPWVRYLADSSYWVYLLHFPLLLLVEVPLTDLGMPLMVKLGIVLAAVVPVLLLSYDLLVRPTWIGKWLNGHRRPSALLGRRSTRRVDAATR